MNSQQPAGIRTRAGLRRRIREYLAGHGTRPAHPGHRRLRMIAELLRHPSGTARTAERPDGRAGGLPDLTRAGLIAALQPRREDGVSPHSTHTEVSHDRSRLRQRRRAGAVGDHPFSPPDNQVSAGPADIDAVVGRACFPVEQLLAIDVGVPVVDGVHI